MSLRSVQSVITGFCSLILIFFAGSAVFYKLMSTIDRAALPVAWQTLYDALDTLYGVGLGMILFVAIICILVPLAWIFMGKKGGDDYRS